MTRKDGIDYEDYSVYRKRLALEGFPFGGGKTAGAGCEKQLGRTG